MTRPSSICADRPLTSLNVFAEGVTNEARNQNEKLFGNELLKVMARQSVKRGVIRNGKGQRSPTHILRWTGQLREHIQCCTDSLYQQVLQIK